MAHRLVHFADKAHLEQLEGVIVLGLVGFGLLTCALGAIVYDVGRLFSAW